MIWSNRAVLQDLTPQPSGWGLPVILLFGTAWFFAYFSGIAEWEQFAVIGIIQGVLLSVLGGRVYRRMLLPFWYLWLTVPSGQFLVPVLETITAKLAGFMLDLTAIPTFHEGFLLEVPSGRYLVAPGCAGLNFLLAGIAVSMAFAELTYRSWSRKLAFILSIVGVTIFGNALRVFLIIVIAHMTNNVGDIVDDHLIYGWGFFSLLLLGCMALGNRFHQSFADLDGQPPAPADPAKPAMVWPMAGVALVVGVVAPAVAHAGWSATGHAAAAHGPNLSCRGYAPAKAEPGWMNQVPQADILTSVDCQNGERTVHFAVALLNRPLRKGKLVGLEHWLIDGEHWPFAGHSQIERQVGGQTVPVSVDIAGHGSHRRMLWSLHWVDGQWLATGVDTAIADLKAELGGHRQAGLVLLATDLGDDDGASANMVLTEFLAQQPLQAIMAGGEPAADR